ARKGKYMTGQVLADGFYGSRDSAAAHWLRRGAAVAFGVALLVVSAKTKVAIEPVPVTLQTLVVVGLGLTLGARMGAGVVLAYLALGAAGWPVFAGTPEKGVGVAYMMGSTGGYLLGFVMSAALVGWLAERGWDRSLLWAAAAMGVGLAALYVPGVLWLAFGAPITAFGASFAGIGIENALKFGVMPFIWIDALKLSVAAVGFPLIWRFLGR
ncbi:MAG: biotin transporter BioY, partial [Pseudomonadota bacterium]